MPTRYIRAATHTLARIVATIISIDRMTCQTGGLITATRNIINVGAKNGTIESTIDDVLLGFDITSPKIIIGTTIRAVTGNCACWASSSLDTVAPTIAYKVENELNQQAHRYVGNLGSPRSKHRRSEQ